ncbi:MAG: RcnB family protein [Pseudomonadota bacterium]
MRGDGQGWRQNGNPDGRQPQAGGDRRGGGWQQGQPNGGDWRNNGQRGNDARGGNDGRRDGDWRGRDDGRRDGAWRGRNDGRRDGDWRNNGGNNRNWNRNWHNDNRYNWRANRDRYRNNYHLPRYYAPYGWDYGYRRFGIGFTLSSILFEQNYWIDDPEYYGLPPVFGPYRWVRYYNDALLVDIYTGQVVDTVYDIFW